MGSVLTTLQDFDGWRVALPCTPSASFWTSGKKTVSEAEKPRDTASDQSVCGDVFVFRGTGNSGYLSLACKGLTYFISLRFIFFHFISFIIIIYFKI